MEISRIGPESGRFLPIGRPEGAGSRERAANPRPPAEPDATSGAVFVSPEVRLIMALHQAVQNASDIRPEVVAGLRARIEGGRYAVNEFELARLLVRGGGG